MFTSETGKEARSKASPRGKAKLAGEIKNRLLCEIDDHNVVEDLLTWIYEIDNKSTRVSAMIKLLAMLLPKQPEQPESNDISPEDARQKLIEKLSKKFMDE